jgi:hypothetical protein
MQINTKFLSRLKLGEFVHLEGALVIRAEDHYLVFVNDRKIRVDIEKRRSGFGIRKLLRCARTGKAKRKLVLFGDQFISLP